MEADHKDWANPQVAGFRSSTAPRADVSGRDNAASLDLAASLEATHNASRPEGKLTADMLTALNKNDGSLDAAMASANARRSEIITRADLNERYVSGDPNLRAEVSELNRVLGKAESHEQTLREIGVSKYAAHFKLNPEQRAELIEWRQESPEIVQEARERLSALMADAKWRDDALNHPASEARREMGLINSILARGQRPWGSGRL
jgi:hypothetical protein